jgi:hypothetical protein
MPLTQQQLKQRLWYRPDTGDFYWRFAPTKNMQPWQKAGSHSSEGYIQISVCAHKYPAHHLAWLYTYGVMPNLIDHQNQIRDDNRISNLRMATVAQNNMNKKAQPNSKTGLKGVYLYKKNMKYTAAIKANGRRHYLGYFNTPEEAHQAYIKAAGGLHGEFAKS